MNQIRLLGIRFLLFLTFPLAFLIFSLAGAFEALYEKLRITEDFLECQVDIDRRTD